jgi:hypothetical protein
MTSKTTEHFGLRVGDTIRLAPWDRTFRLRRFEGRHNDSIVLRDVDTGKDETIAAYANTLANVFVLVPGCGATTTFAGPDFIGLNELMSGERPLVAASGTPDNETIARAVALRSGRS